MKKPGGLMSGYDKSPDYGGGGDHPGLHMIAAIFIIVIGVALLATAQ